MCILPQGTSSWHLWARTIRRPRPTTCQTRTSCLGVCLPGVVCTLRHRASHVSGQPEKRVSGGWGCRWPLGGQEPTFTRPTHLGAGRGESPQFNTLLSTLVGWLVGWLFMLTRPLSGLTPIYKYIHSVSKSFYFTRKRTKNTADSSLHVRGLRLRKPQSPLPTPVSPRTVYLPSPVHLWLCLSPHATPLQREQRPTTRGAAESFERKGKELAIYFTDSFT